MNKLDSFNKDKIKCQKCKKYYDRPGSMPGSILLCMNCRVKWELYQDSRIRLGVFFSMDHWCNNEQS
jgi:hypothetical protein